MTWRFCKIIETTQAKKTLPAVLRLNDQAPSFTLQRFKRIRQRVNRTRCRDARARRRKQPFHTITSGFKADRPHTELQLA